jgi:hypothetical protein
MLIAGVLSCVINGTVFDLEGKFKYSPASVKNESLLGAKQLVGFKQSTLAPFIEGTLYVDYNATGQTPDDIKNLMESTNASITLSLRNGYTVALQDAGQVGDTTIDTENNTLQVKFEGKSMIITKTA